MPISILRLDDPADLAQIDLVLKRLKLDPADLALERGQLAESSAAVKAILKQVAEHGDEAIVEIARKFDDPLFSTLQLRVSANEMKAAVDRVPPAQLAAIRRSIAQVREYQTHIMPAEVKMLRRPGVEMGMRFTPLESAGLYFPGGKASYPSTLIMLAVPAQVAGVERIVVCTPPSRYGRSDLVLAVCHELKLQHVFLAGGAAAIAAMAFGTLSIPAVDKIVGPGNLYVQLAKRLLCGGVGIDGFLGPSEILVLADETGDARFIASDLIAQAEHDPGSCYLLTTSEKLARAVVGELDRQTALLSRRDVVERALANGSTIIVDESMDKLVKVANRFAAEHVNVQARDEKAIAAKLVHAGAIFLGAFSPVAAGDYVAGPSHCLPTNTTGRFSSGISVYEFLKRSSIIRYERAGLEADASAIIAMAEAESLDGHAASVQIRKNS